MREREEERERGWEYYEFLAMVSFLVLGGRGGRRREEKADNANFLEHH